MGTGVRDVGNTTHPQRDKRTWIEATDEFGRAWGFVVDISAKPKPGPVSLINPVGWDAPRDPVTGFSPGIPPQKYLVFNPMNMFKIGINWAAWKADLRAAKRDWEAELHVKASQMSPHDAGAALLGASTDGTYADASPELLRVTGPRPHPVEPVIAAEQGNSWILGKSPKIDARLYKYFHEAPDNEPDFRDEDYSDVEEQADPEALGTQSGRPVHPNRGKETWTEFASRRMAEGATMKDAGVEWKALKASNAV
jgi:hypothetical protein